MTGVQTCALPISLATETLVSLKGEVTEFSGGAHGNTWFQTRNVWIGREGAQVLALADLFLQESRWRMEVSRQVLAQLVETEAQWILAGEIVVADEELLQDWSLTEAGIVFDFAPYAVSSYSAGSFQVRINYGDLKGLLDPAGPAGALLR